MGGLLNGQWPAGDAPTVTVFRALCDTLTGDADLASFGLTWRLWTGDPRDAAPAATGEFPWVRLTPVRSPMSLASEDAWEVEFRVRFEAMVKGTHYDDLGNLTYYLRRALRYNRPNAAGTTVLNALRAAGAIVHDFVDAGCSPEPGKDGEMNFGASGMIVIRLYEPALD